MHHKLHWMSVTCLVLFLQNKNTTSPLLESSHKSLNWNEYTNLQQSWFTAVSHTPWPLVCNKQPLETVRMPWSGWNRPTDPYRSVTDTPCEIIRLPCLCTRPIATRNVADVANCLIPEQSFLYCIDLGSSQNVNSTVASLTMNLNAVGSNPTVSK